MLGQDADRQLHRGKAGQQDGHTAGVVAAHGVEHAQAVLVVMVAAAQRQVHHGQAVRSRSQAGHRRFQAVGHVHRQAGVGQDFAQNLLPGVIVFDDQGARGRLHGTSSARGSLSRKVVPCGRRFPRLTEPPRRAISVLTHHRPKPSLPGRTAARRRKSRTQRCGRATRARCRGRCRRRPLPPRRRRPLPRMVTTPFPCMASAAFSSRLVNTRVRLCCPATTTGKLSRPSTWTRTPAGKLGGGNRGGHTVGHVHRRQVNGMQVRQILAHGSHGLTRAALDLGQVGRQVGIGRQGRPALVLDALDAHRDGAHLVVQMVQQVGGDVAHGGKGLGHGALFLGRAQRFLARGVVHGQRGVMGQAGEHLFVPLRLGKAPRVGAGAVDAERADRLAIVAGQHRHDQRPDPALSARQVGSVEARVGAHVVGGHRATGDDRLPGQTVVEGKTIAVLVTRRWQPARSTGRLPQSRWRWRPR